MADCFFSGPFPPPLHGQSVATRDFAAMLEAAGVSLDIFNSGEGTQAHRLLRHLGAAWRIAVGPSRSVYGSVNANAGMIMTALLVVAARLARKPIVLHHHSYRYIAKPDALARLLFRLAGRETVHIANCRDMGAEMSEKFSSAKRVLAYSNVGSVDPELRPAARPDRPVTIGHMSNLSREKGTGTVLGAVARLRQNGRRVRLEVAGPCSDDYSRLALARAGQELGSAMTVHGPVYGAAKQAFFDAIDIFAFPSASETQGIVNLEAMACGKPVVAFGHCCIPGDIGETAGIAVPPGEDFCAALSGFIDLFEEDPGLWAKNARERYETLLREFESETEVIRTRLFGQA